MRSLLGILKVNGFIVLFQSSSSRLSRLGFMNEDKDGSIPCPLQDPLMADEANTGQAGPVAAAILIILTYTFKYFTISCSF